MKTNGNAANWDGLELFSPRKYRKVSMLEHMAMAGAFILPLFNIPLIVRMVRRKSSRDVSVSWALGVWVCLLLMAPAGLQSADPVFRLFNWMNLVFFTVVVFCVLKYRKGTERETE